MKAACKKLAHVHFSVTLILRGDGCIEENTAAAGSNYLAAHSQLALWFSKV